MGDFSIPPASSSPAEMVVYFQEDAGIITVEVQRKWLWVIFFCFCLTASRG